MRANDGCTPLHIVAHMGHVETMYVLVQEGPADLDVSAGSIGTPLHCASKAGHEEILRYLLLMGADVT